MSSSWGCPNEVDGICQKVRGAVCDPGMMGCVVQGLVERIGEPKGPRRPVKAPAPPPPSPRNGRP
jgi:hypothetical protein